MAKITRKIVRKTKQREGYTIRAESEADPGWGFGYFR